MATAFYCSSHYYHAPRHSHHQVLNLESVMSSVAEGTLGQAKRQSRALHALRLVKTTGGYLSCRPQWRHLVPLMPRPVAGLTFRYQPVFDSTRVSVNLNAYFYYTPAIRLIWYRISPFNYLFKRFLSCSVHFQF